MGQINNHQHRSERGAGTLKTAFAGLLLGILGVIGLSWFGPKFLNSPFTTEEVDRPTPAVLQELRELSEFRAAQVELEVIVDHEDDVRYVPSAVAGERVQYVAVGTVDAMVDFSTLDADAITVTDGHVVITLPEPTITEPVINLDSSHVLNRDRGIINRVGGLFSDNPTADQGLIVIATDKLAAAAAETDIIDQARQSTESMLETLATGLGYESVKVVFEAPALGPDAE